MKAEDYQDALFSLMMTSGWTLIHDADDSVTFYHRGRLTTKENWDGHLREMWERFQRNARGGLAK